MSHGTNKNLIPYCKSSQISVDETRDSVWDCMWLTSVVFNFSFDDFEKYNLII